MLDFKLDFQIRIFYQHPTLFCGFLAIFLQKFQIGMYLKVAFFQKVRLVFLDLQISKKIIFQKTILSLKFRFPANNSKVLLVGNLNFKLRVVFWNIFFGDLEI